MKRSYWPLSPRRPRSPSSFSSSISSWRNSSFSEGSNRDILPTSSSPNLKVFTFTELKEATRNFFSRTSFDGNDVYEGWIDEQTFSPSKHGKGMRVAVKILIQDAFPGHTEWVNEVYYLSDFPHPNLVKLLGLCSEDDKRLLVYEAMPNINLGCHIFRRVYEPFPWEMRITIAIGVAKALSFLHERHVVHLNVKASSILLDSEFNAKLSNFYFAIPSSEYYKSHISADEVQAPEYTAGGPEHLPWPVRINLAILAVDKHHEGCSVYPDAEALDLLLDSPFPMKQSGAPKRNLNNRYAAPEYRETAWTEYHETAWTGSASPKCDVYSFGVVLWELVTGRVFEANNTTKGFLKDRLIDLKLEGQYSEKAATAMANLVLHCLAASPERRPCMSDVLATLERIGGSRKDATKLQHEHHMKVSGNPFLPELLDVQLTKLDSVDEKITLGEFCHKGPNIVKEVGKVTPLLSSHNIKLHTIPTRRDIPVNSWTSGEYDLFIIVG